MKIIRNDVNIHYNAFTLRIIFALFVFSLFAITTLPGSFFLSKSIYYIQFAVFVFFVIFSLNNEKQLPSYVVRFNFFHFLIIISFLFFFLSSFYVNFEINLELRAIFKLLSYPIVVYLFLFYLPKYFYYDSDLFDQFLNYFLLFSVFAALVALTLFALRIDVNQKYNYTSIGFFAHPNSTAFIYTFAIPILVYKYYSKTISKGLLVVFILILTFGFIFTLSRGGYLGVLTAMSVIMFSYSKKMFFLTISLLVPLIYFIVFNVAASKGDSSYPRLLLAVTAYDMIFNRGIVNMLWGYGIFNNVEIFVKDKFLFGSVEDVVDPHNVFLLLAIQFGLLFTISLIITVFYLLIRVISKNKKNWSRPKVMRVHLCFSICCGIIAQNLLEDIVVYPEYYVMSFFLILLGYLYRSVYEKDTIAV